MIALSLIIASMLDSWLETLRRPMHKLLVAGKVLCCDR